ncbi:LacI family DNA-binding transcriptional regulator [Streptomyces sp. NPDC048305]|uniref:LacI family DNA-binding transcriptional regulator n=1 Tax=Streptomyces sp. NPDC048305 TaxID=3365532 RepID=UPI003719A708
MRRGGDPAGPFAGPADGPPRVGVKDVARSAGVSLGTVSNVLNRPEVVAESTRSRVLEVIDTLGYVRSEGARQSRGHASRVIAVMVLDIADPFVTALTSGVQQAAREAGLGVMVCAGGNDPAEAARQLSLIASHRVRGAVLTSGETVGRTVEAFRRSAVPFVLADECAPRSAACSVGIDDVAGGRAAVRHLVDRGHRSLAFVGGPGRLQQVRDRRRGALGALGEYGLPLAAMRELPCDALTVTAGKDAGHRILGLPERPTAVFCASDLLALGVLQALYEAGLSVPDDIAVVGCDDIGFAASAVVPLTSVRRPAVAMGRRAGRLLIEDTADGTTHEHTQVLLQPELVVRRSTMAAPAR